MSGPDLRPVEEKKSGLPAPVKWMRRWWATHHGSLHEDNVRELLTAYATMDEEARDMVLTTARSQAARWPAVRPAPPALRLVRHQAESAPQHPQ